MAFTWKTRTYRKDDVRIQSKFLWLPMGISEGSYDKRRKIWKWLQRATWIECNYGRDLFGPGWIWHRMHWIETDKELKESQDLWEEKLMY